jgi:YVTN family beta-propeller protein
VKQIFFKTFFLLFAFGLLLGGCEAQKPFLKPTLNEDGELFLYVRPLPHEARQLKFTISQILAVRDDGSEYPLRLSFKDFSNEAVGRQRFLASGVLPPGDYVGLSIGVSSATLQDEEGDERLLVPEKPTRIDCRFTIDQRKATFQSLAFNYDQAVMSGFRFDPAFAVTSAGKPVTGLVGYVSNTGANTLTVFDKQYLQVVGVIATGAGPKGLAIDQQRRKAYVALSGDDAVEVLDVVLGEITNRVRLKPGDAPEELALTPDGKTLLTVDAGSDTVSVIDPVSCLETGRIKVGNRPTSILMDSAGVRAYVFNDLSQDISVIDIPSRTVAATMPSEPGRTRGQLNRTGGLYTTHEMSPFVRVLSPFPSLALQQRYRTGMGSISLKLDTMTNLIYMGKQFGGIEIYEPTTFVSMDKVAVSGSVDYLTIDGEQNTLYVLSGDTKTVEVINLVTKDVVGRFDVDEAPFRVSLMGER